MISADQLASVVNALTDRIRSLENRETARQDWATPSLGANWSSADPVTAGFQQPQYWKDVNGVVYLRGTVQKDTGANETIFTLPADYRPPAHLSFVADWDTGTSTAVMIIVRSDGTVEVDTAPTDLMWVSLDTIQFRTI